MSSIEEEIYDTSINKTWFINLLDKYKRIIETKELPGHIITHHSQFYVPIIFRTKQTESENLEVDYNDDENENPFYSNIILIWDLSINKNISILLDEKKFHMTLSDIISQTDADRIKEICLGIIANMSCVPEINFHLISNLEFTKFIFSTFISSYDTGILNESIRCMNNFVNNDNGYQKTIKSFINEREFIGKLIFVQKYSSNSLLLKNTGEFICNILEKDILQIKAYGGGSKIGIDKFKNKIHESVDKNDDSDKANELLEVEIDDVKDIGENTYLLFLESSLEAIHQILVNQKMDPIECKNYIHSFQILISQCDTRDIPESLLKTFENCDIRYEYLVEPFASYIAKFISEIMGVDTCFKIKNSNDCTMRLSKSCLDMQPTLLACLFIVRWLIFQTFFDEEGKSDNCPYFTEDKWINFGIKFGKSESLIIVLNQLEDIYSKIKNSKDSPCSYYEEISQILVKILS
ncbi:unnamed protein product [Gordionus sp. m RMFG-2023]|uniref:uncharacterized protein LOC135926305 isoform X2 n=1 Tax=Gordionus sp. m RMFG-2023 TaxID=3053472 RepID=UPI0030E1F25C